MLATADAAVTEFTHYHTVVGPDVLPLVTLPLDSYVHRHDFSFQIISNYKNHTTIYALIQLVCRPYFTLARALNMYPLLLTLEEMRGWDVSSGIVLFYFSLGGLSTGRNVDRLAFTWWFGVYLSSR